MTKKATPKTAPQASPEAEEKPLVVNRGKFMDFAPRRSGRPPVAKESHISDDLQLEEHEEPEITISARTTSVSDVEPRSVSETTIISGTASISTPASTPVRRRRTISDMLPVSRPMRQNRPVSTPVEGVPEKPAKSAQKPADLDGDISVDAPVETPAEPAPTPVKPRSRGLRMDFVRRVTTLVAPKSKTKTETETESEPGTDLETTPRATSADFEAGDDLSLDEPEPVKISRKPLAKPTAKLRRDPAFDAFPDDEEEDDRRYDSRDDDDDAPMMSEDDLAVALAGFADDGADSEINDTPFASAPDFSDNTDEAAAFAEEIDALDNFDDLADRILESGDPFKDRSGDRSESRLEDRLEAEVDEFISEPKPLFDNVDPLVKRTKAEEAKAERKALEEKARENALKKIHGDASDASLRSLGGRSPFLTSVAVEKRPLSASAPASGITSLESLANTPVKNTYRSKMKKQLEKDAREIHRQTTLIVSAPEAPQSRNIALIVAIILTILLGAGVGAVVYLVFFQ